MNQPNTMPVKEWLAEAQRLFGNNPNKWKFRCPICGNVQSGADFAAIGAEPQSCYQECIGRHQPKPARDLASIAGENGRKTPCDYAAYGLFHSAFQVIPQSGGPVQVFPFADADTDGGAA